VIRGTHIDRNDTNQWWLPIGLAICVGALLVCGVCFGTLCYLAVQHPVVRDELGNPASSELAWTVCGMMAAGFLGLALTPVLFLRVSVGVLKVRRLLWSTTVKVSEITDLVTDTKTYPHSLLLVTPERTLRVFPSPSDDQEVVKHLRGNCEGRT